MAAVAAGGVAGQAHRGEAAVPGNGTAATLEVFGLGFPTLDTDPWSGCHSTHRGPPKPAQRRKARSGSKISASCSGGTNEFPETKLRRDLEHEYLLTESAVGV